MNASWTSHCSIRPDLQFVMNCRGKIITYFHHLKLEIPFIKSLCSCVVLLAYTISPQLVFHYHTIDKLKKVFYIDLRTSTQFVDPTFNCIALLPASNVFWILLLLHPRNILQKWYQWVKAIRNYISHDTNIDPSLQLLILPLNKLLFAAGNQ